MKWNDLTMKERSDLMSLFLKAGVGSLSDMRHIYDGLQDTVDKVNSSKANFVSRLKDPRRSTIQDWEDRNSVATHKLGAEYDSKGNPVIYPNVQEIDGRLVDFTRPPHHSWVGFNSAVERGDTVRTRTLQDAIDFTERYKDFYPSFKYAGGGHLFEGDKDTEPILDEYSGGTLKESKVTAALTRNQWNRLYKEGKVSLSQIPGRYQSWIEGESNRDTYRKNNANREFSFKDTLNAIKSNFNKSKEGLKDIAELAIDFTPILGDIKGLTYDPYIEYKEGSISDGLATMGLGVITLLPGTDFLKLTKNVNKSRKLSELLDRIHLDESLLKDNLSPQLQYSEKIKTKGDVKQGVKTSGVHREYGTGRITGSQNVTDPKNIGPIEYGPSRTTTKIEEVPVQTLNVQNYSDYYPFIRGQYIPEGINFDSDINMAIGMRPQIVGKYKDMNGIDIFPYIEESWPIDASNNRWLSNKDNNWVWTDIEHLPIELYHRNGGQLNKYPDGGELQPATITERIGRKWDNLYWQKFREPKDYSDEIANTPECAQWSNAQLRKMGYNIWGDAWTRSNQKVKKVFSGYDGLTKPDEYTYSGYRDYVLGAADNVKKNFNWRDLQEGDIVGMYFRGSPNYQKAFLNGANGEAQTHTGHVVYRKGKPYIAHNVHGDIKLNKAKKVIGRKHPYGVVSVYRPYDYGGYLTF